MKDKERDETDNASVTQCTTETKRKRNENEKGSRNKRTLPWVLPFIRHWDNISII